MIALTTPVAETYEQLDPDVQLMMAVRDGNTAAFAELVDRYDDYVRDIIRRFTNGSSLADDLTQEVFMRAFKARKRYQPRSRFTTWITTIARNVALNASRSLRRERHYRACLLELNKNRRTAQDELPAEGLQRVELCEQVREAIESLKSRQREVVQLCSLQGLSYDEAARRMNTSPTAIKSLLHRARNSLKGRLKQYESV